jgi:hypothetical protein
MNSTTLDESTEIYQAMCVVFLSEFQTPELTSAMQLIKDKLRERPDNVTQMNSVFKEADILPLDAELTRLDGPDDDEFNYDETEPIQTSPTDQASVSTASSIASVATASASVASSSASVATASASVVSTSASVESTSATELDPMFRSDNVKKSSKFYHHFCSIRTKVEVGLHANKTATATPATPKRNLLYHRQAIDHAEDKWMAYIALWGGFVLRGTGMSRVNNGVIEQHQGSGKRNTRKNLSPHVHIVETSMSVMTNCSSYLECISKSNKKKKKVQVDSETESDDGGFEEKTKFDPRGGDAWTARREKNHNLKNAAPTGYQKPVNPSQLQSKHAKKAELKSVSLKIGDTILDHNHFAILENSQLVSGAMLSADILEAFVGMFNLADSGGFMMPVNLTQLLHTNREQEVVSRLVEVRFYFYFFF